MFCKCIETSPSGTVGILLSSLRTFAVDSKPGFIGFHISKIFCVCDRQYGTVDLKRMLMYLLQVACVMEVRPILYSAPGRLRVRLVLSA